MATVRLRNISKSFNGVEIIKGVNLDIEDREFAVIVGPSGCGKSTLLRLVAGLEEANSGDLLINGEKVNDLPPAKRGLAMVFQSYALYPHMSVAENMGFSLKLARVAREERGKKVREAARILQIESLLERLGGKTFLHIQIEDGQMFIVEADGEDPVRIHDRVGIKVNGDTCHLFKENGEAIPRAWRHPLADMGHPQEEA